MLGDSIRRRRGGSRRGGRNGPSLRRILRIAGVAVGVIVVGFGAGYLVATQLLFPGEAEDVERLVAVPDLRQQRLPSADRTVSGKGLRLGRVDTLKHPTVAEGAVLAQDPLPGQLQRPGDSVRVTVSGGPERRPVPDIRTLRASDAATILRSSGFAVVRDSTYAEEEPGRVVGVDPPPGEVLALPHEVRLVVSLGPATVEMPLLLTLDEEEARARLDALGLVLSTVEREEIPALETGIVIGQEPAAGTEIERGSAVRLTVVGGDAGTGPEPRNFPDTVP